ncbi:hypothetical protein PR048_020564 [Dryococelus australis]|uniref:Uncharacterized protein n=1 Tax=Dryococelus australis TaxID=614101 RepID=A0ABQ9H6P9_9NEOP|nr:hypothetical protein PR048_020564 [Dryococelus australis]
MYKDADINWTLVVCCQSVRRRLDQRTSGAVNHRVDQWLNDHSTDRREVLPASITITAQDMKLDARGGIQHATRPAITSRILLRLGIALAERLDKPGSVPGRVTGISACGNRPGRCRWSASLLGDIPFPPLRPLSFRRCYILTSTTLIGSRDLAPHFPKRLPAARPIRILQLHEVANQTRYLLSEHRAANEKMGTPTSKELTRHLVSMNLAIGCSRGAGMKGRGKRENPEKTRRPTIETLENTKYHFTHTQGAAVVERLDFFLPANANRVQSPRILPDDAAGRRLFSGIFRFLRSFHSGTAPYSTRSPSSAHKTSLLRGLFTLSLYLRTLFGIRNGRLRTVVLLSAVPSQTSTTCYISTIVDSVAERVNNVCIHCTGVLIAGCNGNDIYWTGRFCWLKNSFEIFARNCFSSILGNNRYLATGNKTTLNLEAAVAQQLEHLSYTKGALSVLASGNRAGRCRWSMGFLGVHLFPPPLHSSAAPYSPHFTLIGFQGLVVKSHPNLSTQQHSEISTTSAAAEARTGGAHMTDLESKLRGVGKRENAEKSGATVVECLERSPPTKAIRVRFLAGLVHGFPRVGIVPGRSHISASLLGDLPFPPPSIPGAAPYPHDSSLIGSQDHRQPPKPLNSTRKKPPNNGIVQVRFPQRQIRRIFRARLWRRTSVGSDWRFPDLLVGLPIGKLRSGHNCADAWLSESFDHAVRSYRFQSRTMRATIERASFIHWLLHTREVVPFLTELHVIGADNCEVFIYWRRVIQYVQYEECFNDKRAAEHAVSGVIGHLVQLPRQWKGGKERQIVKREVPFNAPTHRSLPLTATHTGLLLVTSRAEEVDRKHERAIVAFREFDRSPRPAERMKVDLWRWPYDRKYFREIHLSLLVYTDVDVPKPISMMQSVARQLTSRDVLSSTPRQGTAPVHNVCSVVVTLLESRRATSYGYNSSHPVWHALYECLQDIHGDSSPFLLQPFHELSNGFWPRLTSPHPAIQFVPKMFYRVEVGALGGPDIEVQHDLKYFREKRLSLKRFSQYCDALRGAVAKQNKAACLRRPTELHEVRASELPAADGNRLEEEEELTVGSMVPIADKTAALLRNRSAIVGVKRIASHRIATQHSIAKRA